MAWLSRRTDRPDWNPGTGHRHPEWPGPSVQSSLLSVGGHGPGEVVVDNIFGIPIVAFQPFRRDLWNDNIFDGLTDTQIEAITMIVNELKATNKEK